MNDSKLRNRGGLAGLDGVEAPLCQREVVGNAVLEQRGRPDPGGLRKPPGSTREWATRCGRVGVGGGGTGVGDGRRW